MAETETILEVSGMSCGNCVKHVTGALRGVPGVQRADVDLAQGRAVVTHDAALAPIAALIAAVEAAGYDAKTSGSRTDDAAPGSTS